MGEIALPEGIIRNGEIVQEGSLTTHLSQWIRTQPKKVRTSFFAVSLPEEKSFLRIIRLPPVDPDQIGNAIRWEIEAHIPLKADEVIYDYEVINPPAKKLRVPLNVAVTAFPKATVDAYVRTFLGAGMRIAVLELESQAITRAISPNLQNSTGYVILDIGRTRTSIIICVGSVIVFTTTLELGGDLFEENIAKTLHVSREEALRIKKEIGLQKHAYEGNLFAALAPGLAALSDEIRRTIGYYQEHVAETSGLVSSLTQILLVGGDANLIGIATYLSASLQLPARTIDPFSSVSRRLRYVTPPILYSEALGFTTTIGLTLRPLLLNE